MIPMIALLSCAAACLIVGAIIGALVALRVKERESDGGIYDFGFTRGYDKALRDIAEANEYIARNLKKEDIE